MCLRRTGTHESGRSSDIEHDVNRGSGDTVLWFARLYRHQLSGAKHRQEHSAKTDSRADYPFDQLIALYYSNLSIKIVWSTQSFSHDRGEMKFSQDTTQVMHKGAQPLRTPVATFGKLWIWNDNPLLGRRHGYEIYKNVFSMCMTLC